MLKYDHKITRYKIMFCLHIHRVPEWQKKYLWKNVPVSSFIDHDEWPRWNECLQSMLLAFLDSSEGQNDITEARLKRIHRVYWEYIMFFLSYSMVLGRIFHSRMFLDNNIINLRDILFVLLSINTQHHSFCRVML